MQRVMLKAGRRPIASEAIPQNEAPTIKPTKREQVANRESVSDTPNSIANGVKVRATPYDRLADEINVRKKMQVVPATKGYNE